MTRNTKTLIAAVLLAGIVFSATFFLSRGGNKEVENLIIAYNNTLMKAHYELKPSLMQNLTSERELSKIDNYMAYLLKNNRSLRGTVKEIQFKDVKVNGPSASVATVERWVYEYVDPVTKQPVSDTYDVYYGNTYSLKKTAGHWIVEDLESKEIGGKTEG